MCCITALQPKQRGLGVENSSLNLGMWEFTHHYLAVCTNALQKITNLQTLLKNVLGLTTGKTLCTISRPNPTCISALHESQLSR